MYEAHFGLREPPFSIAPNPRFVYLSERHREALAHLMFGLREGGGFVQLTGEVGTGKTTICRTLLKQLPEAVDVALIFNPQQSESELLESILQELGAEPASGAYSGPESAGASRSAAEQAVNTVWASPAQPSAKRLTDRLYAHLLDASQKGRRTVVIVDEAQNLRPEVLETLRLLTNLETDEKKLLQIFLIGQPELKHLLSGPSMRQIAQRVTARFHLQPLSEAETCQYIAHRLEVSGSVRPLFDHTALRVVHQLSGGIPRVINTLCDRALLGAFVRDAAQVDEEVVRLAHRELGFPAPATGMDQISSSASDSSRDTDSSPAESMGAVPATRRSRRLAGVVVLSLLALLIAGGLLHTLPLAPPWASGKNSRIDRAAATGGPQADDVSGSAQQHGAFASRPISIAPSKIAPSQIAPSQIAPSQIADNPTRPKSDVADTAEPPVQASIDRVDEVSGASTVSARLDSFAQTLSLVESTSSPPALSPDSISIQSSAVNMTKTDASGGALAPVKTRADPGEAVAETPQIPPAVGLASVPVRSDPAGLPSAESRSVDSIDAAALTYATAQQRLAIAWGFTLRAGQSLCVAARQKRLACLNSIGTLAQALAFGRPVLVELHATGSTGSVTEAPQGPAAGFVPGVHIEDLPAYLRAPGARHAVVLAADEQHLLLATARGRVWLERSVLVSRFGGYFTLLWQPPLANQTLILPWQTEQALRWLESALTRWSDSALADQPIKQAALAASPLEERIRALQARYGLLVDGVAGPVTLAHLTSALALPATPTLEDHRFAALTVDSGTDLQAQTTVELEPRPVEKSSSPQR